MNQTSIPEKVRRDWAGILASLLVIVFFSAYLFIFDHPLARSGSALVILSAGLICRHLVRRKLPSGEASGSAQAMLLPLRRLEDQRVRLLRMLWWNIAPLMAGLALFCLGLPRPGSYKILLPASAITVTAIVGWLTLRSLNGKIELLRAQLEITEKLR